MPKIIFQSLDRGVKVGKGTFNEIHGTLVEGGKPFNKRYFASEAEINQVAFTLQPGEVVEAIMTQRGEYQNLTGLIRISGQAPPSAAPPATGTTQQGEPYTKREKVATAGGFRPPAEISRTEALRIAASFLAAFKAPGASVPEAVKAAVDAAEKFHSFIVGPPEAKAAKAKPKTVSPPPATGPSEEYELGPAVTRSPHAGDDIPY